MKSKTIAYWVTTVIAVFALLPGGVAQLMHQPQTVAGIVRLGYPIYFTTILGFWKVSGGLVLLAPGFPRVKEWAYAGAFFDLTGAAASHAASGDYGKFAFHIIVPLLFAVFLVASWALRPASRRVGNRSAQPTTPIGE
jgi:hypothetical protein